LDRYPELLNDTIVQVVISNSGRRHRYMSLTLWYMA